VPGSTFRLRRTAGLLCVLIALASFAARSTTRADDGPAKVADALAEKRRTFENGLEAIVLPSARAHAVVVVTTFRCGPRDEGKDEAGVSQLIARLYRKAPAGARATSAAESELGSLAASVAPNARDLVGFEVRHDAISFWAVAPEDKLANVLEVEKDRIAALAPTPELLEDVRSEAVFNAATAEGETGLRAWSTVLALAYGDCGLGRTTRGTSRAVSKLGLKEVEAWRHARLRPDNAFVVVAGAHDPEGAFDKVAKTLGSLAKPADPLPPRGLVPPSPAGPLRAAIEGAAVARKVYVAFRGPDAGGEDEAAFLTLGLALHDRVLKAVAGATHEQKVLFDAEADAPALLYASLVPRSAVSIADVESRATGAVAAFVHEEKLPAPALAQLQDRLRRLLEAKTRPLDAALVGRRDARPEEVALVEAATERASAEPLVRRREAVLRRLAALTPEALREAAQFYLAPERARVVVVGDK